MNKVSTIFPFPNYFQNEMVRSVTKYLFAAVLIVIALVLTIRFFDQWPIEGSGLAIDWRTIWPGIQDARLHYENLRNPPWAILFILPLGLISLRSSWGILSLATIAVLLWSVPRVHTRWQYMITVLLLIASYISLRQLADGNLEGLVIFGILLFIRGYQTKKPLVLAVGVLAMTAKVQETWLLSSVLVAYLLVKWPWNKGLTLGGILALVMIPTMLAAGRDWLTTGLPILGQEDRVNMTLQASLNKLALPSWFIVLAWLIILVVTLYISLYSGRSFGREKVAMLVSASMLLAPYAAGNSWLTILAIGIIPLLQSNFILGLFLYIVGTVPALFPLDFTLQWSAVYWTVALIAAWIIFSIRVARKHGLIVENSPSG